MQARGRAVALGPALLFVGLLAGAAGAQRGGDTSTATGISNLLNPAISLNGLFAVTTEGEDADESEALDRGFNLQEVELQLTSTVEPYTQADVILAVPGLEGLELEEGIVATRGLPGDLAVRFGKFYQDFGRHNRLHTHQFPFIDGPLPNVRLLGDEGLNEVGGEAAYLTPLPWYSEAVFAAFQGQNPRLASPDDADRAYLLRARKLISQSECNLP